MLAFWIAYILTRPLGASIGDLLTQAPKDGGLGISDVWVNAVFFACIVGLIAYLTISKVDQPTEAEEEDSPRVLGRGGIRSGSRPGDD